MPLISPIPSPLILVGVPKKQGLSPSKIASEIISRKGEAGIPIGALPSGEISQDEIMERIRADVFIKNLQEDAIITVAIPPGTTVISAGASLAGPVNTVGSTTTITKGYGQIS